MFDIFFYFFIVLVYLLLFLIYTIKLSMHNSVGEGDPGVVFIV